MTAENPAEPALENVRKRLREANLRCTAARLWVMQELIKAHAPLSHAQVADTLAPQGFDRATIYRNLIELSDAGLVSRIELGDHVWRFELKRPNQDGTLDHPHFVCVDCGEVTCLPDVNINLKPAAGSVGSPIMAVTEVLLKGRCGHCPTSV
ncbi:MAG: transcriptional repressor [Pirellulales bacterium]|nr:transcriptional repressor [Pirellulales bacterium]